MPDHLSRYALSENETIENRLQQINTELVVQGKFLEALQQLMMLGVDHFNNSQLWLLVGHVYTRIANWSDALSALDTAIELNPMLWQAQRLKALALFSLGRRQEACDLINRVVQHSSESGDWMLRAYILAHASSDPIHALQAARDWGRRFADPLTRNAKPLQVADKGGRKRLKVGYVTADFREHSIAFFMMPIISHHNSENVEIYVYNNGHWDAITAQIRASVSNWLDVVNISDEDLCAQIRQDGIDVLVDLSGFTHGHRLGVFARRAAPVQVTWLGYMQPLGMKAMDYRLVDMGIAPLNHAIYYSEKLFYLKCMAAYAPPAYSPLCEDPPMLRNGYPTLISLNSSAKITDEMLRTWAKILHLRADARLIIMVKELSAEAAQADMQPRVQAAGMPLDRVSVMHQQPLRNFMELGYIADIALDTSPISGGTTTLQALWMGMLIVCMDAERGVDASTARTLRGLGFGGEIAKDEQSYIDAALLLMNSPERLQIRRKDLRDRMRKSVLMDYASRTAELEKAYRLMWLNWVIGKPKALSIDTDIDALIAETGVAI